MRNNTGKHPKICNFKQQSKRREYNAFSKTFFLNFEKPRSKQLLHLTKIQSWMTGFISGLQFYGNWKNFRNQGIIN